MDNHVTFPVSHWSSCWRVLVQRLCMTLADGAQRSGDTPGYPLTTRLIYTVSPGEKVSCATVVLRTQYSGIYFSDVARRNLLSRPNISQSGQPTARKMDCSPLADVRTTLASKPTRKFGLIVHSRKRIIPSICFALEALVQKS